MNGNKIIFAVVGLPGAGKSEAAEYIKEKTSWSKIHFGNSVVDEVIRRGQEPNQANEKVVRDEFRRLYGMGALATINLPKIKELFQNSSVIIESMYSWEEYLELKKEFGDSFKVLAIFASPKIRTERMAGRSFRPLTPEELIARDYSQIETLHQAGPIARADYTIINESSEQDLHLQIDEILSIIN